ncbi:MAG: diacylglycerol kinase [Planctomycetaceae bacterium]|nr:diacylglycerol kinase [Planctomycetaceae bacterium]
MPPDPSFVQRSWFRKFRDAFRGIVVGVHGQSSFQVHLAVGVSVVAAGIALHVTLVEWCILALCITGVLTAEMFNSSLESMAKAITGESDPHLGNSLDIASAAVLVASIGSAIVGAVILGHRLGVLLKWW